MVEGFLLGAFRAWSRQQLTDMVARAQAEAERKKLEAETFPEATEFKLTL